MENVLIDLIRSSPWMMGVLRAVRDESVPDGWTDWLRPDTLLCRCEEISAGEARQAIKDFALRELNRLKAVSRIGMGRCQGRVCGAAAAELLANETGRDIGAVGRLRALAPPGALS